MADSEPETTPDRRLYVPGFETWSAHLKTDWEREYCFLQEPDEDFHHLLMAGEIHLQRGDEKYCLNCAMRSGFITSNRLFWQRGSRQ